MGQGFLAEAGVLFVAVFCLLRFGFHSLWVYLKIGYIPNYSHLIGIMIINHWV